MDSDTLNIPSHFYELQKCSGMFTYTIDDREPCFIKFNARIMLKVTLNDCASLSNGFVGSRDEFELQATDSINAVTSSERHGSFPLMEEKNNDQTRDNEGKDTVMRNKVAKNPHCDKDMTDDFAEGFESFNSHEDALIDDVNKHKDSEETHLKKSCNKRGKVSVDTHKKEESLSFPFSDKRAIKDLKTELETKKVRIEPQALKTRVYRDNLRVKSKKVNKKRKTEIDDKCKQEIKDENESVQGNKESNSSAIERISKGRKSRLRKLMVSQNIKCDYCQVTFSNKNDFYNHRRSRGSSFECKVCHKVEAFEAHLLVHMLSHEPNKGYADMNDIGKQNNGKRKHNKIKCSVCGLLCSQVGSLINHMMLHTKESPYCCCVCEETFSSLSSLRHHLESHKVSKRIQCKECKERFASRLELSEHKRTHDIKCDLCGEQFPNKTSRTCHYRTSHPNEIKRCSECHSLFSTDEELRKHVLYHRRNKKDQCPVCGVVVTKLKDHMAIHATAGGEKLYACDKCPMKYNRKLTLIKHLRIHSGERPYACNVCPKTFRCNGMLRKHLLTHSLERPFVCELCGKKFSLRSNLVTHMRIHSESRKYPCPFCLQAFNYKTSLEIHLKCKHNNNTSEAPHLLSCVHCLQTFDNESSRKAHVCDRYMKVINSSNEIDQEQETTNPKERLLLYNEKEQAQGLQQYVPLHEQSLMSGEENLSGKVGDPIRQRQRQPPSRDLNQHLPSLQIQGQSEIDEHSGPLEAEPEVTLSHRRYNKHPTLTIGHEPTYITQEPPMMPFFYSNQPHGNQILNPQFSVQNPPIHSILNLDRVAPFETATNFSIPNSTANFGNSLTLSSAMDSHEFERDRKYELTHHNSAITSILSAPPILRCIPPVEHLPDSISYGNVNPVTSNKSFPETNGLDRHDALSEEKVKEGR